MLAHKSSMVSKFTAFRLRNGTQGTALTIEVDEIKRGFSYESRKYGAGSGSKPLPTD